MLKYFLTSRVLKGFFGKHRATKTVTFKFLSSRSYFYSLIIIGAYFDTKVSILKGSKCMCVDIQVQMESPVSVSQNFEKIVENRNAKLSEISFSGDSEIVDKYANQNEASKQCHSCEGQHLLNEVGHVLKNQIVLATDIYNQFLNNETTENVPCQNQKSDKKQFYTNDLNSSECVVAAEDLNIKPVAVEPLKKNVENALHSSKKPFKCIAADCDKCYTRVETLINHNSQVHSNEKPYECNFCSKKFSCKQNCDRHFRTHTNDKPYECDVCGRKFPFQRSRDRHYRTHTNVKKYECNICKKKFSRNQGLKSHYLTHTKEKPHQCELCSKRFPRKGSLRQHYRLHTNEKPYDCEVCGKSFALKRNRDKHNRVVHMHIKPFHCKECDKSFTCKTTLACHYSTHTNEKPYVCETCNKKYSHKASLTLHNKQHIN